MPPDALGRLERNGIAEAVYKILTSSMGCRAIGAVTFSNATF
jgi:hypothetical protein